MGCLRNLVTISVIFLVTQMRNCLKKLNSKHDSIKGKRILDTAGGNKYEILEKEEREEWGEGGRKEESGREREREW
jgi:hypothetical protein